MNQAGAIKRLGVVRRKHGVSASIELLPMSGCIGCERMRRAGTGPGHCGIDLLGLTRSVSAQSAQHVTIDIPNQCADGSLVNVGDTVEVHISAPDWHWVALACRVYVVPTMGLILGAAVGRAAGEPAAIVFAMLGLCAGLYLGRRSVHVPQSITQLTRPVLPALRIVNLDLEARS